VATAVVREPQNTWSNLAFGFVGALIFAHARRVFSRCLGLALVALGLASGASHASLLPSLRTADVATMGWTTFALSCFGYASVRGTGAAKPAAQITLGAVGGTLAMTAAVFRNDVKISEVKPFDTTYVTVAGIGFVFILLVVGIFPGTETRPASRPARTRLGVLAATVAAAIVCQLGVRPGNCFCRPDALLQAHALWHVLTAFAVFQAYELFAAIESRQPIGRRTPTT